MIRNSLSIKILLSTAVLLLTARGLFAQQTAEETERWWTLKLTARGLFAQQTAENPFQFRQDQRRQEIRQQLIERAERFLTCDSHFGHENAISRHLTILNGFVQLGFGTEDPFVNYHLSILQPYFAQSENQKSNLIVRFRQIQDRINSINSDRSQEIELHDKLDNSLQFVQKILSSPELQTVSDKSQPGLVRAIQFIQRIAAIPTAQQQRIYSACPTTSTSNFDYQLVISLPARQSQIRHFLSIPNKPQSPFPTNEGEMSGICVLSSSIRLQIVPQNSEYTAIDSTLYSRCCTAPIQAAVQTTFPSTVLRI